MLTTILLSRPGKHYQRFSQLNYQKFIINSNSFNNGVFNLFIDEVLPAIRDCCIEKIPNLEVSIAQRFAWKAVSAHEHVQHPEFLKKVFNAW